MNTHDSCWIDLEGARYSKSNPEIRMSVGHQDRIEWNVGQFQKHTELICCRWLYLPDQVATNLADMLASMKPE